MNSRLKWNTYLLDADKIIRLYNKQISFFFWS